MENEWLKIFDHKRNQIGVASRDEVHRKGYWHEAFHCWFICEDHGTHYIWLQLRSHAKKDYPNLLDITAAGHLLAHETTEDGVREIKEELGIEVPLTALISLGTIDYSVRQAGLIDNEIASVFLYKSHEDIEDVTLQEEEVSGMVKVRLEDFSQLWLGNTETIHIKGFNIRQDGNMIPIDEEVTKDQFVPHEISYYQTVIQRIEENI